jgi:diguanylate cyclase (GGDEF)-like protein
MRGSMKEQLVRELMSAEVLCARPDTALTELASLMHENAFSCIVISDQGVPVGIVTERDIVAALDEVLKGAQTGDVAASEVMSTPVYTIEEDRPVFEAIVFCRSRNVRHIPVVDRKGTLIGLITQSDLTQYHMHSIEEQRAHLQNPDAPAAHLLEANERLQALAHEDALLGIGNRRAMEVDLQYTHEASLRYGSIYAVAVCDVDYFKLYNDSQGHQAGDELLRLLTAYLRDSLRKADRIYRYGGDELLVVLPMTSIDSARSTFERLVAGLVGLGVEHESSPLGVLTMSCGISGMQTNHRRILNWKQVFDEADHALYQVKRGGRNGVASFKGHGPNRASGNASRPLTNPGGVKALS